jgi:hypothetical protein
VLQSSRSDCNKGKRTQHALARRGARQRYMAHIETCTVHRRSQNMEHKSSMRDINSCIPCAVQFSLLGYAMAQVMNCGFSQNWILRAADGTEKCMLFNPRPWQGVSLLWLECSRSGVLWVVGGCTDVVPGGINIECSVGAPRQTPGRSVAPLQ